MRPSQVLRLTQGLQAARRPARTHDQPDYAEHRSAQFLTGETELVSDELSAGALSVVIRTDVHESRKHELIVDQTSRHT